MSTKVQKILKVEGVELFEVQAVLLGLLEHPTEGDIVGRGWYLNFPVCADLRHGKKETAAEPRRSVQHFLNIAVLSHILSWYRPKRETNKAGELVLTKKFSGHMLQINRKTLATELACTVEQVSAALTFLAEKGFIKRVYSKADYYGTDVKKVVLVLPLLERIAELNVIPDTGNCLQNSADDLDRALKAHDSPSLKSTTVPLSSAQSFTSEEHNGSPLKRSLSHPDPKGEANNITTGENQGGDGGAPSEVVSPSATGAAPLDPAQKLIKTWCKRYQEWFGKTYRVSDRDQDEVKLYFQDNPRGNSDVLYPALQAWVKIADAGYRADRKPSGTFDAYVWRRSASKLASFLRNENDVLMEMKWESKTRKWEDKDYNNLLAIIKSGRKTFLDTESG